jgi:hypothetical protein
MAVRAVLALAFGLAAWVTLATNQSARFALTPALTAELAFLLQEQGLAPQPLGDPPGALIDAALRFDLPDCPVDGFLLPVPDVTLIQMQAVRFSELTGARYRSTALHMGGSHGPFVTRLGRWLGNLRAIIGLPAPRHGHTVVALFVPEHCPAAMPDLRAFWAPAPPPGLPEAGPPWI